MVLLLPTPSRFALSTAITPGRGTTSSSISRWRPATDRRGPFSGAWRGLRRCPDRPSCWIAPASSRPVTAWRSARRSEMASCTRCTLIVGAGVDRSARRPLRPVRPVADGAVPGAVPPVRGGARPRPDVASRLPRSLQHRRHRHDAAGRTAVPRHLAGGVWRFPGSRTPAAPPESSKSRRSTAASLRRFTQRHSIGRASTTEVMGAAVMAVGTTASPVPDARGSPTRTWTSSSLALSTSACSTTSRPRPGASPLTRTGDARRSTGSFYTPRTVTAFLVRHTLEPLVRDRTADEILRAAHPRPGDGQRRVPRRRLPVPRSCGRRASRRRRPLARGRHHAVRPRGAAPRDRATVSLRRRSEPDGRPARAAVDLAREPGVRQAAHVSGSSSRGWQQPDRRDASTMSGGSRPAAIGQHRRPEPLPLFGDMTVTPVCRRPSARA